nr:coiled-coil domain-containing protein 152 [Aotus nancymaae]
MDQSSEACMKKISNVNLDKLINDFSQIEKKMIETNGKNNILDIQLEKTNCLLKVMQAKEVSVKEAPLAGLPGTRFHSLCRRCHSPCLRAQAEWLRQSNQLRWRPGAGRVAAPVKPAALATRGALPPVNLLVCGHSPRWLTGDSVTLTLQKEPLLTASGCRPSGCATQTSSTGDLWCSSPCESPGLWAVKIRLEMRRPLTLCAFSRSCNRKFLLIGHLGSPPGEGFSKCENEQLKISADLIKEKLKSHEQEYKNNIAKLISEMRIKEEGYKTEISKLYQDMQKKVELNEEKHKELIGKKEMEISELNAKLRNQEKEKQNEIIKLQLEFDAKLARVQTKSKSYPDSTVLPQSIYRRKLQHFQEEKNKEIAILRNTIRDLEQRLSIGKDSHLKRRRF